MIMIKTFSNKETATLFIGLPARKFCGAWVAVARRKLYQIHAANRIDFLRIPPGNQFEKLSGNRKEQWSIRINTQFRICFRFENSNAFDVEIVDYH